MLGKVLISLLNLHIPVTSSSWSKAWWSEHLSSLPSNHQILKNVPQLLNGLPLNTHMGLINGKVKGGRTSQVSSVFFSGKTLGWLEATGLSRMTTEELGGELESTVQRQSTCSTHAWGLIPEGRAEGQDNGGHQARGQGLGESFNLEARKASILESQVETEGLLEGCK